MYIRRGGFLYLPEPHQASQRYTQHRGCNEERRWESEEKKNKSVGPLKAPISLQAAAAAFHDSQIPRKIADKIASAWDADGPRGAGIRTRHGQRPAGKGRRRTADRCRVRAHCEAAACCGAPENVGARVAATCVDAVCAMRVSIDHWMGF